jgi:hypothetical protein
VAQPVEYGEAVLVARNDLAIDQAGSGREAVYGCENGGVAIRPNRARSS